MADTPSIEKQTKLKDRLQLLKPMVNELKDLPYIEFLAKVNELLDPYDMYALVTFDKNCYLCTINIIGYTHSIAYARSFAPTTYEIKDFTAVEVERFHDMVDKLKKSSILAIFGLA